MTLAEFKDELRDNIRHNRMQASILRHVLSDNIRFLEERLGKLRRALDSQDDVLTLADHGQLPYSGVVQDLGQKIDLDACRLAYFIGDAKVAATQLELVKQIEEEQTLDLPQILYCDLPKEMHSIHVNFIDPAWKPSGHHYQSRTGLADSRCGFEVPPLSEQVEHVDRNPVHVPLQHAFKPAWKNERQCAVIHTAGGIRVRCSVSRAEHPTQEALSGG